MKLVGDTAPAVEQPLRGDLEALCDFGRELSQLGPVLPSRINADPTTTEQGLAKLVLTLVELVRRLLERQAIRRIEAGSLTDEEIERMGQTFLKLDQKMAELTAAFGLKPEDLNLNLGPLGDLM
ncbi:MAG: gas vesicle protein K [Chloroflexi bacterium]|nr:gas vesicle protein K [Chloroflexota bacterium]